MPHLPYLDDVTAQVDENKSNRSVKQIASITQEATRCELAASESASWPRDTSVWNSNVTNPSSNLERLERVAEKLGDLCEQIVFLGGATVELLITDSAGPTDYLRRLTGPSPNAFATAR
jgi:hypothetical protein